MTAAFYAKWKQYQYYVIIGIVSVIALFFLPMLGSTAGLAWVLPTTVAGWVVYITSKLLVGIINILIFHCFNLQAKINIAENERYLEALQILRQYNIESATLPRSPEQYNGTIYGKKGVTIFLTSVISAVGLTQAVLTFDIVSMLTYFFTILMGVIFGILQMNQTEIYWTVEFYDYAKYTEKTVRENKLAAQVAQMEAMAKEAHIQPADDSTSDIRGTDILESSDSTRATCDNSES